MQTIVRKSLLYKSGLGFYCINPVQGCSHGCKYPCYAWMMAESHGRARNYEDWCQPKLVANAYELLNKELSRLKSRPDYIHLCLSTDPFMQDFPEVINLSLRLVELINSFGISASVLTKGLLPSELADIKRFSMENMHGISLVSINEEFRSRWEPGTIPYTERIAALHYLHKQGKATRVHMEPYPTPNIMEQDLKIILEKVEFVDEIFLGRWNYNRKVKEYRNGEEFYHHQYEILRQFCHDKGIKYLHT